MTKTDKKTKTGKVSTVLVARIGVAVLLCVYPLFLVNRYIQMTHAKMMFFGVSAFVLFAVINMVMLSTENTISKKNFSLKEPNESSLLIFAGLSVVSCLLATDIGAAFTGENGRYMGLITVLAMTVAYIVIAEFFRFTDWVVYAFTGVTVFMNVIAFLQLSGYNPFGLYTGASEITVKNFYTTLGNRNIYSSFICLIIPFFIYLICGNKSKIKKAIFSAALIFAYLGLFAARSDGSYLCIAAVLPVTAFSVRKNRDSQKSLIHSVMLFFVAGLITAFTAEFKIDYGSLSYLSQLVVKYKICIPAILILTVIYLIFRFVKLPGKATEILFTAAFALGVAAVAAGIGLMLYFSFINKDADLGRFAKYLRIDDEWGSHRGYTWRNVFELFGVYPFYRKLFGCGEDCLHEALISFLGTNNNGISDFDNTVVDNAHNEYLHIFITHGLLGILSYLGFIFHTVKKALKSASVYKKAALFAAFGYMLQAMVNLWQPITTPLLFVFLALSVCRENEAPAE